MLNYSPACERNRQPIWNRLAPLIDEFAVSSVLEVGSGSGQHALFFYRNRPDLEWYCTELEANYLALKANLEGAGLPEARILDVCFAKRLPKVDLLYSANTLHIMDMKSVEAFFCCAGEYVRTGGILVVYGPFRYQRAYTSESNAEFDRWLQHRDPESGLRDFDVVNRLASRAGFRMLHDYPMPANNQLLVWRRQPEESL